MSVIGRDVYLFLIGIFLLLLLIMSSPVCADTQVQVTLYIHESSVSGILLPGVQVIGHDGAGKMFNEVTDAGGKVVITGSSGTWYFEIVKPGYTQNPWGEMITSDVIRHGYMMPVVPDQVQVTLFIHESSVSGPLLPGVQVIGHDGAGKMFNEVTDAGGKVVLTGSSGTWYFEIVKPGYTQNPWGEMITSDVIRDGYMIPVVPDQVQLSLYVHEGSELGPALQGVLITGTDGAGNPFSGTSDSAGCIIFNGAPGTWSFTASKSGYDTEIWTNTITSSQRRDPFLQISSATPVQLTLYVHEGSKTGPILQGVLITGTDGAGISFSCTTDSSGLVVINGAPGTWQFTASKSGYTSKTWSQPITITEERHAFISKTSVSPVTLTLYVHEDSASGPLLQGVLVTGTDGAGSSFSGTTGSSGSVIISGAPGTWQFTASKSGYTSKTWSQPITITEERHAFISKTSVSPVTLTLYVHEDSASGPLLQGVLVTGTDGSGNSFSGTTDSSGLVVINGAPGTWYFTASKSGYDSISWEEQNSKSQTRQRYLQKTPIAPFSPGWKFHADLLNSGIYDNGGIQPNNNLKWSNTGYGAFNSPSIANGIIYVGTEDGHLYAYEADTGVQRWVINCGTVRSTPAILGTNLFFGSCDGKLYAVKAETGKEVWNFTTGGMVGSSPAIDNERVFFGTSYPDGRMYAVSSLTGELIWSVKGGDFVHSSPALMGDKVYFLTGNYTDVSSSPFGNIIALDVSNGIEQWRFVTNHNVYSSPTISEGILYAGAGLQRYAINAENGNLIWSTAPPFGANIESTPTVFGNRVYYGDASGTIFSLDATTGSVVWTYTTGNSVSSSPAYANGIIYVGSGDTKVYALDAETGIKIWDFTTDGPVCSSPLVWSGTVYVGSGIGLANGKTFYAIGDHSSVPEPTIQPPPTILGPGDPSAPGPIIDTLTPKFNWTIVPDADEYGLYIRDLSTDTIIFDSRRDGYTITGDYFILPSGILQSDTHYRWNMNSHSSAGWNDDLVSGYSQKIYFTTPSGTQPQALPVITESLALSPEPYKVGDTISATYTIRNDGSAAITFSNLTVGGRYDLDSGGDGTLPDGTLPDFTHRSVTLQPGESYDYQGELTFRYGGKYHFFCAYSPYKDNPSGWNCNVPTVSLEGSNEVDIYVEDNGSSKIPVILIHGWQGAPDTWDKLSDQLIGEGYPTIILDYSNYNTVDPRIVATTLDLKIKEYKAVHHYNGKFDIVCHSMGALVSRWYIEQLGGEENIRQWIGIAPATQGSNWADVPLGPFNDLIDLKFAGEARDQLRTDSETVKILSDSVYGTPIKYHVIVGINLNKKNDFGWFPTGETPVMYYDENNQRRHAWNTNDGTGLTYLGDGAVAVLQSYISGATIDYFEGLNHVELTNNPDVIDLVIHYLKNPDSSAITQPPYSIPNMKVIPYNPMVGGKIDFFALPELDSSYCNIFISRYQWDVDSVLFNDKRQFSYVFTNPKEYSINLNIMDIFEQEFDAPFTKVLFMGLYPGDILICRAENSFVPGFWTHCGIYVGGGKVVEPLGRTSLFNPGKVEERLLSDWIYPQKTYVEVLRLKNDQNNVVGQRAAQFAIEQVDKEYDWKFFSPEVYGPSYYCSELVWASYLDASDGTIDLNSNSFTNDLGAISPTDIEDSEFLAIVGEHKETLPATIGPEWGASKCPIYMTIVDSNGSILNRFTSEIEGGIFVTDPGGVYEEFFIIQNPDNDCYQILIDLQPGAQPNDTYKIQVIGTDKNGTTNIDFFIENALVRDIPENGYIFSANHTMNADFIIEMLNIDSVIFSDISTGNITTRHWSFGDGTFAENVTEITHTYAQAGNYTVTLTVSGPDGDDSASQVIQVTDVTISKEFLVQLNGGWNIFSTPIKLEPGKSTFEEIFSPTEQQKIQVALGWDGGHWFIPDASTQIDPLYAYFIKIEDDTTATAVLVPSETITALPSRQLTEGINLIGPAPAYDENSQVFKTMPVDQGLVSIENVGDLTGYVIVVSPNINQPGWAYAKGGQVKDLLPFKGYWITMENGPDTMYGFSTTPI